MMGNWKRAAVLALTVGICLGLAGCREEKTDGFTTYDAEVYVDGLIKENYLGQADEAYMELVGIHEDDVETLYENALSRDANYFFVMYDIDYPTDELTEEVQELFREIYTYTKYEVVSAVEQEDGSFSVKVNVCPIDIVQMVNEAKDTATKDFYKKYPNDRVNAMSDEEYEKMDKEWARLIVDLYHDMMDEIGNMTQRSISVQIEKNENGAYTINSDDFARLDELILDYTNNTGTEE